MNKPVQVTVDVEIEGTRPLLQNNYQGSPGIGDKPKETKRRTSGIKDDSEEWKGKLYRFVVDSSGNQTRVDPESREGKLGHPGAAVESALVQAARDFKADKRRTMREVVKSLVEVNETFIELVGKKEPDCINRDSVVNPNTRGRGLCYRPQFNPGWKAKFSLTILDAEVLPVESVKEILDYAGFRIGIGDHRPKFGKFMVTKFVARK